MNSVSRRITTPVETALALRQFASIQVPLFETTHGIDELQGGASVFRLG
jgi:hypothetical protein